MENKRQMIEQITDLLEKIDSERILQFVREFLALQVFIAEDQSEE